MLGIGKCLNAILFQSKLSIKLKYVEIDSFYDFGQILTSFNPRSHSNYKRPNVDVYLLDQVLFYNIAQCYIFCLYIQKHLNNKHAYNVPNSNVLTITINIKIFLQNITYLKFQIKLQIVGL
jgi:hypothetical protein